MEYTPLAQAAAAVFVTAAFAWLLYRLWLGQEFGRDPAWSARLDGLAYGGVAVAGLLVVQRVVGL